MKRRVALIVETSSGYGRAILSGVARFMRAHEEWSVFLEERDLVREVPPWLAGWGGDGILSRITGPEFAAAVRSSGVPLVDLTDRLGDAAFPSVRSDDGAIGRAGFRHLAQRGFRRFAFCGFEGEAWSDRRRAAFVAAAQEIDSGLGLGSGGTCPTFLSPWYGPGSEDWEDHRRRLAAWIAGLPRPIGLMACNDVRGMQVLDVCGEFGVKVPDEVAVVGVDDDQPLCRICRPPLSSVVPDAEAVGYHAAETLAALMNGLPPATPRRIVPPVGLITRRSSDVVAIEDPRIAAAVHFIRRNASRGITVDDVLREIVVSRSTLERKFRRHLGRSPQQEIREVQVNRAKELLLETQLTVDRIAELCGFRHPEYLHVVFNRVVGRTPGEFRAAESKPD